jgi:hypothetical protein
MLLLLQKAGSAGGSGEERVLSLFLDGIGDDELIVLLMKIQVLMLKRHERQPGLHRLMPPGRHKDRG